MTQENTTPVDSIPDALPDGLPDIGATATSASPDQQIAALIAAVPAKVEQLATQMKQGLHQGYIQGYAAAWKSQAGLTPKQFWNALGTKGLATVIRAKAVYQLLVTQYPDEVAAIPIPVPENYTLSFDIATGIVTVTEK